MRLTPQVDADLDLMRAIQFDPCDDLARLDLSEGEPMQGVMHALEHGMSELCTVESAVCKVLAHFEAK